MDGMRMCKYCGNLIVKSWGRKCRPHPSGDYCSKACAEACHGFDMRIAAERSNGTVSFDPSAHDRACHNTPQPWELIDPRDPEDNDSAIRALDVIRASARIDPRLPGMLSMILDGSTMAEVAKAFGISQPAVTKVIQKARARLSDVAI